MIRARFSAFVALLVTVLLAAVVTPAQARAAKTDPDVRELARTDFTLEGRRLPLPSRPSGRSAPAPTPPVGTERQWLGLDETTGKYYPKPYTLKAVGNHIEVWVARDLAFPAADCRTNSIEVSDANVAALVTEFDQTIYPKETAAFSTPRDRDGTRATMDGDFTGDGNKTVTLVDNIRDDNFFRFPAVTTYVAGFFSRQLNELFDRNVMTIDAYDWKHRLGAQPANDPTDDLCTSRPARPRMYEATFAHEWLHLLQYNTDPKETTWLNEGLADFASTLTGYADARNTVHEAGNDTHLMCFQGWGPVKTRHNPNARDCGGPQNSLNLWDEGAPSDVLADYGNAFQFFLYLRDRFGPEVVSTLHRDGSRQGLASMRAALPADSSLSDVLHDYQLMTLVDDVAKSGVDLSRVTAPSLRSSVNLGNKAAYDEPGAAPNGADYVPLPTPLRSVSFEGATHLRPLPLGWTTVGGTLFSGNGNNLDAYGVRPVTIPAGDPVLTLETSYGMQERRDFGYVTISTNGGRTFHSVTGDRTTPGPHGPGLTGISGSVVKAGYNLSPYAGKSVLLGLRYVSDGVLAQGGWRIGTMTLAGRVLTDGTTMTGWRPPTEINPTPVHAWQARLVGLRGGHVEVVPVAEFRRLASYPKVVAVISHDEPTEQEKRYAPYRLVVNGALQPGGGTEPYAPGGTPPRPAGPSPQGSRP
ncbi:immune inhibitor A domain-containing protein [Actinoplanes solisilvae]|uniref:immune inhibitor A domain-containing protein n=1 Tax=Actinoplanes solisilvae TaxID=2486853 RepID=UPI000FDB77DC|nr:immune inhibitor A domain-containing protein [Actinoplanes solisilvae]